MLARAAAVQQAVPGWGTPRAADTLPVEESMTPLIDSTRPVWS